MHRKLDDFDERTLTDRFYVIWLCKSEGWSSDYFDEIFDERHFIQIDYQNFVEKNDSSMIPRVVVYNVENAGNDGTYQIVREFLSKFQNKIVVLFHVSDEFQGGKRKWKYGRWKLYIIYLSFVVMLS